MSDDSENDNSIVETAVTRPLPNEELTVPEHPGTSLGFQQADVLSMPLSSQEPNRSPQELSARYAVTPSSAQQQASSAVPQQLSATHAVTPSSAQQQASSAVPQQLSARYAVTPSSAQQQASSAVPQELGATHAVTPSSAQQQASSAVPQQLSATHAVTPSSAQQQSSSAVPVSYRFLSRLEEQNSYKKEMSLANVTKVICSLDLLLEVFQKCREPGCNNDTAVKHHLVGPSVVISWTCPSRHKGRFESSRDVNDMKSNNLQTAASILLSGNNFAKIEKMAKFLGLSFVSESTFYRLQRLYFVPAINEWWTWQREQIIEQFCQEEIVVCGDGQCNSPGHTAKNLCYFLMELVSGYIVEVEVRDKRHVGLTSANMEKAALQIALQRLRETLNVVEVVTDASTTIKKMIGKSD